MSGKTEKEKALILKYIIITVLVAAFFLSIIFAFYTRFYEVMRSNIIKDGKLSAIQAADLLENYLNTNTDCVKLTAFALDEMIADKKPDSEIQDYLVGQSIAIKTAVNENSTGIYGYINGKFFSGTDWQPPEGFDAKARPWYLKPLNDPGEITVLDPYYDIQSGHMMLALGKTLCDGESVVSVDVSLDRIQAITENAVMIENADAEMIINDSGVVIAHSDKSEIGKNYRDETSSLGAAVFTELVKSGEDLFEISYDDSHYIVFAADIQKGWHCISVMDATDVFNRLRVLFFYTIAAALIIIAVISLIMLNSGNRQITAEQLNSQLSSMADIYISLHEINFASDTFTELQSTNASIGEIIGSSRHNCQELIRKVIEKCSDPSTRDEILDFVDFTKLNHRLIDRNTITAEFLSAHKRWRRARFIVSERIPNGKVARAMFLVEDIDAEKRERDTSYEAAQLMNEQIASVANIYFTMQDIDIPNDTLNEIKTKVQKVSELVGGRTEHAQATMYAVMDQMSHESSRMSIHEFIDLSTLNERLKNTNTITEEFLSHKGVWSRARFVVSKRAPDGRIEHVLWLVEGIDAEKRRRDRIAEAADTLNYRLSSIANIYMTAHELDLENDTFTEIRSDSYLVNDVIGSSRTHARETLQKVMKSVTDSAFTDEVCRFTDLFTIADRLGSENTIATEYLNRDKKWRRGRFVASRRGEDGRIIRVMWLVEDIDKEKSERDRLISLSESAVAANKAKSSFLLKMSHNIRTPIHAILGMNELVLRECGSGSIREYSENIRTSGATLLGLVNDILDISSIEEGRTHITPVRYDISCMISDLISMIQPSADSKGIDFSPDIGADIPKLLCGDDVHIKEVILNLLTNAVNTTQKGSIFFGVHYDNIPGEPDSIILKVSVRDTGAGTVDENGEDLGITIAKSLLGMMGSSLETEKIKGPGSSFFFRIRQDVISREPLGDYGKSYRLALEKRRTYRAGFTAPEATVLVTDYFPVNVMLMSKLLGSTGISTDTALSGEQAVKLAKEKKYDLIILDLIMPEKNGVQTLREIRAGRNAVNASTPAVCLTANAVTGAREQYIGEGFNDYLTKPLDPEKLEEVLMKYLPYDKLHFNNDGKDGQ